MTEEEAIAFLEPLLQKPCTYCETLGHIYFGGADHEEFTISGAIEDEDNDVGETFPQAYSCLAMPGGVQCTAKTHHGIARWTPGDVKDEFAEDNAAPYGDSAAPLGSPGTYRQWIICNKAPTPPPGGHARIDPDARTLSALEVVEHLKMAGIYI